MNPMIASALLLALVARPQEGPTPAGDPAAGVGANSAADVFETYYEEYLRLFPRAATEVGDHRYDHLFENDISAEHRALERELYERTLERCSALERGALGPADRMSLEVLEFQLHDYLKGLAFPGHLLPLDQMRCAPVDFADAGAGKAIFPFETVADHEHFLGRIDGFVVWVDTAIANMFAGIEQGVVLPRLVAQRTLERIRPHAVSEVEASAFFVAVRGLPASFAGEDRARLEAAYREAIAVKLLPAYARLADFLEQDYLPHCRDSLAWSALPGGPAWYAQLVRSFTTTDLSPGEIHGLGLREAERIGALLAAARARASEAEPEPRYATEADLSAAYQALRARIEPHVGALFGRFPRTALEIRATDWGNYYEPGSDDSTRPGAFRFGVGDLAKQPAGVSEALFLHEAIPGHHYQISLQRESDLPRFRKGAFFSAYMEGWGLYAESLGPRLGLFQDPHQDVGRLDSEMFRALRLVLDTGFHALGWSMEDAQAFLARYGYGDGLRWELERYVAWPGQALAYKVGEQRILALRALAREELGERFDLRAFHDVVLGTGAIPLTLLEAHVRHWIAEQD